MRHAKKKLQLNRFTSWHDATVKSLVRNIFVNQSIRTTLARAKAARPLAEQMVSLAKVNTLFARRRAQQALGEHKLVVKLFDEIGPLFAKRSSGFTRIVNLGKRRGDDAEMVIFELTELKQKEIKKAKKAKAQTADTGEIEEAEIAEQAPEKEVKAQKDIEQAQEKKISKDKREIKEKKPQKNFLSGLKGIFKKERSY